MDLTVIVENIIPILLAILIIVFISVLGLIALVKLLKPKKIGNVVFSEAEKKCIALEASSLYLQNRALKDIVSKINTMELIEVLREQMKEVDLHLDIAYTRAKDKFNRESDNRELKIIINKLIDRIRIKMRENHFNEKTPSLFSEYKKTVHDDLYPIAQSFFDAAYFTYLINVIFDSAREIAEKHAERVKALWVQYATIQRNYSSTGCLDNDLLELTND